MPLCCGRTNRVYTADSHHAFTEHAGFLTSDSAQQSQQTQNHLNTADTSFNTDTKQPKPPKDTATSRSRDSSVECDTPLLHNSKSQKSSRDKRRDSLGEGTSSQQAASSPLKSPANSPQNSPHNTPQNSPAHAASTSHTEPKPHTKKKKKKKKKSKKNKNRVMPAMSENIPGDREGGEISNGGEVNRAFQPEEDSTNTVANGHHRGGKLPPIQPQAKPKSQIEEEEEEEPSPPSPPKKGKPETPSTTTVTGGSKSGLQGE